MHTFARLPSRSTARRIVSSFLASAAFALCAVASASPSGVVISQVYGGGGNSGAPYTNDFIELFNAGNAAVDIGGWSVQYASKTGTSWTNKTDIASGTTLQPGQYFLIGEAPGSGNGVALPTPDLTGVINLAGTGGKVALVTDGTILTGACPVGGTTVADFVGFGSANCFEGTGSTAATSNSTAALRAADGCTDSDDNSADFSTGAPTPRNTTSPTHLCGNPSDIAVSIGDVSHPEGNSGTTAFDFTVHLSQPAVDPVTFDITTTAGSATADDDYTTNSVAGATIAAGQSDYTFTVLVTGDTVAEPDETFTVNATNITGTNVVTSSASATGTIVNDDVYNLAIYTIQGSPSTQGTDGASPYVGQLVHTSGIVTVLDGGSFYVQTADADADSDPLTSNAIYVFRPANATPTVVSGDAVSFDATVSEYYGLTELSGVTNLVIASQGNPLPTAVTFDTTTPSPDPAALSCGTTNFECFEGMLVTINDGMVTTGSGHSSQHTYDFLNVTADGTRSLREPGLFPGNATSTGDNDSAGHWDGNPEVFEMSPNEFAGVNDDQTPITGGSTFTATGVIGYSFGNYEFYPTALTVTHAAPVPRAVPTAFPSTLRVGSFNVERFCDDVDDTVPSGTDPIPPGKELSECSGGTLPTAADYTLKTQRLGDYIGTVLNLPDVLAVEEVENISVLTRLADELNADYPGVHYVAKLIEGNDIGGIDVGYLVNTDRVQIFAVQQLDKDLKWLTPNNNQRAVFDHPPLLLQGIFTGAGQSEPFMVMVNHLKARQNVDKVTSTGVPTAQAREDQEKRFRQAYAAALLVQDLQTSYSARTADFRASLGTAQRSAATGGGIPLLVVGDFNAYQFTDGYVDSVGMIAGTYDFTANLWDPSDLSAWNLQPLTTPFTDTNVVVPPLWNAVTSLPTNEQYSYLFSPNFGAIQGYGVGGGSRKIPVDQVLDHALLNEAARKAFVRMDYGRANQDAASEDESSSTGPIGVSDHDGFVVQLSLDDVIFANGFEANN